MINNVITRRTLAPVVLAAAAVAVSLTAGVGPAAAAPAAVAAAPARTARVVIRPVTAAGRAAPGFRVTNGGSFVDCSFSAPSPVAVSRNIDFCSPDAADPVACWKAAAPHQVLCFIDARHKHLIRWRLQSSFAVTRAPKRPAPLDVRLATGTYCQLNSGGAGDRLRGHPNWAEAYICGNGQAIWAPQTAQTLGVNMNTRLWTVRVAPQSGKGRLITRRVARAWFVGTRG